MVCPTVEDMMRQARWDGALGNSRQALLQELSSTLFAPSIAVKNSLKSVGSISPSAMIPDHRLAVLLDQIKQGQIAKCLYHNPSSSPSLFTDHMCDRTQFPLQTAFELNQSTREIYVLEFSHDGKRLAASGEDATTIIYDTNTFQVRHTLREHTDSVVHIAWSPDDTRLITCSVDNKAKVWDTSVRSPCLLMSSIDKLICIEWSTSPTDRSSSSASINGMLDTGGRFIRHRVARQTSPALPMDCGWASLISLAGRL